MSKGINKVILIGNLGTDPEVRYTSTGNQVTHFSLATNDSWKDKQTGELQERTEWHKISLFDKLAQIAAEYLKKGSKVYIEGSIRTNKWKDPSGNDKYSTEIIANTLQMLDSKDSATKQKNNNFDVNSEKSYMPTSHNAEKQSTEAALETDDIPF